jgi:DNA-binding NtrC family response regulator
MDAGQSRILIVDDEENVSAVLTKILERRKGYDVACASTGEEALDKLETEWFDLVVTDLKMPGMSGIDLLSKGKTLSPTMPFIMLTAFGSVHSAVEAMKEGAYDYLIKPVDADEFKMVVEKALELHRLQREVARLRSQLEPDVDFQHIVGRSKAMRAVLRLIRMVSKSNATILIEGESGTGKELIARAVHQNSARSDGPFIAVDCAGMPDTLLESEVFGHVRGAFPDAVSNKKGFFVEAHGGTILLDEIDDTSMAFQSKLARALQESTVRPLGSSKSIEIDVRVIATTNKDLRRQIERKSFRKDLFYRLAVVPIHLPPLRERRDDIPLLTDHFVKRACRENDLEPKKVSPQGIRQLMEHQWPGNVRELENVIARATVLSSGPEITADFLFPLSRTSHAAKMALSLGTKNTVANQEKQKIIEALREMKGNRSRAARRLGISRAAFYKKLRSYDLSTPKEKLGVRPTVKLNDVRF